MLNKTLIAFAASSVVLMATAPAFAGTQDDIATCRSAIAEEGKVNLEENRLNFETAKGKSRKRTLTFTAKSKTSAEQSKVTCVIVRSTVTELTVS